MLLVVLMILAGAGPALAQHRSKLVFQVEPKSSECYFLEVDDAGKDKKMIVEVAVLRGGLLDILVDIHSPSDERVMSHMYFEGKGENKLSFVTFHTGEYRVCFDNTMSRWTPKVVSFRLSPETEADGAVKPEDLTSMESILAVIRETMDKVADEQDYLKEREATHSSVLNSTYNKLTVTSILESAVLLLLAMVQIYFVRRWFDSPGRSRV